MGYERSKWILGCVSFLAPNNAFFWFTSLS